MSKTRMAVLGFAAVAALSTGLVGTASAAPQAPANAGDRCVAYLLPRSGYPGNAIAYSACYSAYNGNLQFCMDLLRNSGVPLWVYPYACAIAYAGD